MLFNSLNHPQSLREGTHGGKSARNPSLRAWQTCGPEIVVKIKSGFSETRARAQGDTMTAYLPAPIRTYA